MNRYFVKRVINTDFICIMTFFLINDVIYLMTCLICIVLHQLVRIVAGCLKLWLNLGNKLILFIICLVHRIINCFYLCVFQGQKYLTSNDNFEFTWILSLIFINQTDLLEWSIKWKVCINVNLTACQKSDTQNE